MGRKSCHASRDAWYERRVDAIAWSDSVRSASHAGDADRLRELFRNAVDAWGPERASRRWQETLSAYDAAAVTG